MAVLDRKRVILALFTDLVPSMDVLNVSVCLDLCGRIADSHYQGYDSDHKDIDLIRLKNFTLGTRLSDEEVVGAKGLDRISELVGCMVPFVSGIVAPFHGRLVVLVHIGRWDMGLWQQKAGSH